MNPRDRLSTVGGPLFSWVWVKIKLAGDRRFWSMFPFTSTFLPTTVSSWFHLGPRDPLPTREGVGLFLVQEYMKKPKKQPEAWIISEKSDTRKWGGVDSLLEGLFLVDSFLEGVFCPSVCFSPPLGWWSLFGKPRDFETLMGHPNPQRGETNEPRISQ